MKKQTNERRTGHTLIELALSMVLLLLVIGLPIRFMASVADAQRDMDAVTTLSARGARVLERVTERMQGANPASIFPQSAAPPNTTFLAEFEAATAYSAGAITWGQRERIALESSPSDPVDGIDNDGDGLVDEGRIVWILDVGGPNEQTRVLCENVPAAARGETLGNGVDDNGNGLVDEPGFCMTVEPVIPPGVPSPPPTHARVRMFLTLADVTSKGERIEVTMVQSVALRCRN